MTEDILDALSMHYGQGVHSEDEERLKGYLEDDTSQEEIKKALDELLGQGLIYVDGNWSCDGGPATDWYAITEKGYRVWKQTKRLR